MTTSHNWDAFRLWLVGQKGISDKGSRDAVSRAKRAYVLLNQHTFQNYTEFEKIFELNTKTSGLPSTSASSIKRAVKLHLDFKKSQFA